MKIEKVIETTYDRRLGTSLIATFDRATAEALDKAVNSWLSEMDTEYFTIEIEDQSLVVNAGALVLCLRYRNLIK